MTDIIFTIKNIDNELWVTSTDEKFREAFGGAIRTSERIFYINMNEITNWCKTINAKAYFTFA